MDSGLVVRARDGDLEAFSELVEQASGRLLAMARLVLRDGPGAEDAVQEALVEAWRSLPSLREPDRFEAWLRRLTLRACFDRARREKRHRIPEIVRAPDEPAARDTEHLVAQRDELERGLQRLTPDQRAVLVVTYYLDLPLVEGAGLLGIPVGTMKSRLDRARSALQSALDAEARTTPAIKERYA